ncbi:MAG: alpha/beta hydrolase [Candidatus Puniceispirillaceae bacterium]
MKTDYLDINDEIRLAYQKLDGNGPTVVFLAGHGSDMFGSKAEALACYCEKTGQAFVRFDYQGHGLSSGDMMDGTISAWTQDALAIVDMLTTGPILLVGSSLGGWIMLAVAKARASRVMGCIGIAAAPDFTERLIWQSLRPDQQEEMAATGQIALPNPYADEDVIYPYQLITDGRQNLLLDKELPIMCPVILHQGMADHEVPWQTACDIAQAVSSPDVTIHLRKDSGHRFSSESEIAQIIDSVKIMLNQ